MRWWFRLVVAIVAGVAYWSSPLGSQVEAQIQYSLQGPERVEGVLIDTVRNEPISFAAAEEDGMLTLRVDLSGQSVTVRKGRGELHVASSRNAASEFSTLSDDDKRILRRLVAVMDTDLKNRNDFYTSALCLLRNLSAWRTGMPLAVSVDAVMETVGNVSIPVAEIREAERRAMAELRAATNEDAEPIAADDIKTLCKRIGRKQTACYPTSLVPYNVKCEIVLVGGLTCRGRCGTTCNGLCDYQRYTQDCHNHDRCADVKGIAHDYCNFIFKAAFDDCARAPKCNDTPGVWTVTFKWFKATRPGTSVFRIDANGKFTTGDGNSGTWSGTETLAKIAFNTGCRPVYTAALSRDRLKANGTMKCRTSSNAGTFSATKSNGFLSGSTILADESLHTQPQPRGVMTSAQPE